MPPTKAAILIRSNYQVCALPQSPIVAAVPAQFLPEALGENLVLLIVGAVEVRPTSNVFIEVGIGAQTQRSAPAS